MRRLDRILKLDDFEPAARKHLPRPLFTYVSGGVEDFVSVRDNRSAFEEWGFVPRVLVGVGNRTPAVDLLGRSYAQPFGIGPMGISAMTAYRGDVVLARCAAAAKVPMVMSGSSLIRLEEIIAANPDAWFQAYLPGDLSRIDALIDASSRFFAEPNDIKQRSAPRDPRSNSQSKLRQVRRRLRAAAARK